MWLGCQFEAQKGSQTFMGTSKTRTVPYGICQYPKGCYRAVNITYTMTVVVGTATRIITAELATYK